MHSPVFCRSDKIGIKIVGDEDIGRLVLSGVCIYHVAVHFSQAGRVGVAYRSLSIEANLLDKMQFLNHLQLTFMLCDLYKDVHSYMINLKFRPGILRMVHAAGD